MNDKSIQISVQDDNLVSKPVQPSFQHKVFCHYCAFENTFRKIYL